MSNVHPIRPGADVDLGLDQLEQDGGPLQQPQPGALSRFLRGCGVDDKLPPIPTVKRIETMPVTVGVPISRNTPRECECPSCRIFEKEAHADMCPKCAIKGEVRSMNAASLRRRYDGIDREIRERDAMLKRAERQVVADANMLKADSDRLTLIAQLDAWDVDWRLHYGTIESAEANYLRDRQP